MDWNQPKNKKLLDAILALKNADEAGRFLRDLMTEGEIVEFAKRLQTAEMLQNDIPYTTIKKTTGLSSTTIARVSKWLQGELGGYRLVLVRLHHHASASRGRGLH